MMTTRVEETQGGQGTRGGQETRGGQGEGGGQETERGQGTSGGQEAQGDRGREAISVGLLGLLRPAVRDVDESVRAVRESQMDLREQIESLAAELRRVSEEQAGAPDLDVYVKKLLNARRRVVLVNNILQNVQERLARLNHNVSRESARRRTILDPSDPTLPGPV
uniref:Biogenesis of lysosome-related organelles complex 1 subunit 7 n=2 Tax=Petromyzon marinus TaxID=7757 RepID=A0AAJ7UHP1_PETMA|nr:SNARE-associated protein Snapin [Petromyzon marinus]XP_032836668.1 SNARE-associated protein Snapin [Petromyzon marinus]